jgi:hypothetical protein
MGTILSLCKERGGDQEMNPMIYKLNLLILLMAVLKICGSIACKVASIAQLAVGREKVAITMVLGSAQSKITIAYYQKKCTLIAPIDAISIIHSSGS